MDIKDLIQNVRDDFGELVDQLYGIDPVDEEECDYVIELITLVVDRARQALEDCKVDIERQTLITRLKKDSKEVESWPPHIRNMLDSRETQIENRKKANKAKKEK